jgi:YgiT-type zinc finger domain-containing protein
VEVSATGEEDHVSKENGARCAHCGSLNVRSTHVRSAFWHDERLVVVEDLPAIVCEACHEQFYDDQTMVVLDLMRGDGFPAEKARHELRVPVFSFQDRLAPQRAR